MMDKAISQKQCSCMTWASHGSVRNALRYDWCDSNYELLCFCDNSLTICIFSHIIALDAAMAISGGLDMRQQLSFKRSIYARHYKSRLTKQQFLNLLRVTSISVSYFCRIYIAASSWSTIDELNAHYLAMLPRLWMCRLMLHTTIQLLLEITLHGVEWPMYPNLLQCYKLWSTHSLDGVQSAQTILRHWLIRAVLVKQYNWSNSI